jgi:ParB family transcriptional regulator, chromosome partitioning protein
MRVSWTGLLTQSAVAADSDLGTFVGIAAYEAAGGTVTRDLFSGDEEGFMDDAALSRLLSRTPRQPQALSRHKWRFFGA